MNLSQLIMIEEMLRQKLSNFCYDFEIDEINDCLSVIVDKEFELIFDGEIIY